MTLEMLEHNLYYQIILILPYIVDYYIPVDIYNTLKNINNTLKNLSCIGSLTPRIGSKSL